MSKKHSLLFGAHMSIVGGIDKAIERGQSIGCTAIQIFTKSNRQWKAKELTTTEIDLVKAAQKKSPMLMVDHAPYLINIGAQDAEIEKKSTDALLLELMRCNDLDIPYLVLHPGSHGNTDEASCLERISNNLNKLFHHAHNTSTMILLETMAGQGNSVGYTFEHIKELIQNSDFKKRLGVCFDTCHAFAAGYDFRTEKTYHTLWDEFDRVIGIKKLKAMHINDSAKDLGSLVDRHANIGQGKLGLETFRLLFNDPQFFDIPKILETPKDSLADDEKNMKIIYSLISTKTRALLNMED